MKYPGRGCPNERLYAAMVSAMDDAVGAVLQTLKFSQLDKRTLVVFLSDNGAPLCITVPASNGPLQGEKGDVLEGGIRVPFFVQWIGHIPAGIKIQAPVSTLDLLPTFLAVAGQPMPVDRPIDGQNLLPILISGKEPQEARTLYWLFRLSSQEALHSWGIREGNWKYWHGPLRQPQGSPNGYYDMENSPRDVLFDMENDSHEDHDLTAGHPEKRQQLMEKLGLWMKELPPPAWGPSAGKPPPCFN